MNCNLHAAPEQLSIFMGLGSAPSFIFMPLVPMIKRAVGKKNMFYIFLSIAIVGMAFLYIVAKMSNPSMTLVYIAQFVKSTGVIVATGYMWALVPEVISYGEYTSGKRIAVVPSFSADISGGQRLNLLRVTDWASAGTMPAIIESMAQSALIPRLDRNGNLRSVAILNCSISNQEFYTVRLRTGGKKHKFIWKKNGLKDVVLKATYSGDDAILQVPNLEGWNFGWIQVK